MPYIDPRKRSRYHHFFTTMDATFAAGDISIGEINYLVTGLLMFWLRQEENKSNGVRSYTVLNSIMGILSAVSKEFYRRIIVPYEERKQAENGDVF